VTSCASDPLILSRNHALIGDYFTVGMMMNAVDQHVPPERRALLPALTR
jgi:hypothetical protein